MNIDKIILYYKNELKDINKIIRRLNLLNYILDINKTLNSELIDEYLIPQELEKKQNAEISTPYKLRQEILNLIDKYEPEFWKTKHKVFEPCSGKGGFFNMNIILLLMFINY